MEPDDPDDALRQTARWLALASRLAVLTGAGVSAESGLATFRGGGGLWEGHRVQDVATPSAFRRNLHKLSDAVDIERHKGIARDHTLAEIIVEEHAGIVA